MSGHISGRVFALIAVEDARHCLPVSLAAIYGHPPDMIVTGQPAEHAACNMYSASCVRVGGNDSIRYSESEAVKHHDSGRSACRASCQL